MNKKKTTKKNLLSNKEDSAHLNQKKITYQRSKFLKTKVDESYSSSSESEMLNEKKHKMIRDNMFLNDYMKGIIKKTSDYTFVCELCKRKSESENEEDEQNDQMYGENLYNHLKTNRHKKNTPEEELEELEELKIKIEENRDSKQGGKKKKVIKDPNEKNFLEFIAFAVSLRLSYSQISKLGTFLKTFDQEGRLNFLKEQYFDEEVISNIVKDCFRPFLAQKMYNEISQNPFSLSLDTSTMCTENICALRVRYLKEKNDLQKNVTTKCLENKLLGIATMGESSNAKTLLALVENKVLLNDTIKMNFIGITHDNASSFTGSENGLITLLRDKLDKYFYDLPDPCHSLNLAVQHSLETLPDEIMDFVTAIHAYFSYPQRKAKLKKIQSENNYPLKLLLNYGGTRWLSLGQCLRRLLEIWGSLVMYMNQPSKKASSKKEAKKIKYFESQLSCEIFYLKIVFLEYILNKINGFNEQLQNQTIDISKMKSKLKSCFNNVLEIVCKPMKFETPFPDLILKDWESKEVQEEYFMQGEDFVQAISELINPKFDGLFNQSEIIQEDTIRILQEFLAKLLNLFQVYINFSDNVLE